MDGFLTLLKPPGMSSSDLVIYARKRLPRGTRVGHGGTLDPDAAGVLPVCVGRAARLFDYIIDKQKTYIAELTLGVVTDTQDASGHVLERHDASSVTEADVRAVLPRFVGEIDQIPPIYSALKRGGKKLCDLARKGETVELEPRKVHVYAVELLGRGVSGAFRLKVTCGKGTYIRTLCHDIGVALGVGGCMSFLLRSEAGVFKIENAVTPEELQTAFEENRVESLLLPLDAPLHHIRALNLDARWEKQVSNGMAVQPHWHSETLTPGETVRVYVGGVFAGMAEANADGTASFRAVLMTKD